jgi:5-hydroxyisourate hydrolase-like protein (transthyretin family)
MRRILLSLWLLIPIAAAQSANSANQASKIRLEGRVMSTTGEAIRKANVRLQASGGIQGGQPPTSFFDASDNDGKFLFDDVVPGRYILTSEKAGFLRGAYGARSTSSQPVLLTLSEGQEMKDLVILMTPQGVISGHVTDADGDPIRGVQVMALRSVFNQGRRQLTAMNSVATGDQGSFRVSNLAPGRYYLSATDRTSVSPFGPNERPGRAGGRLPDASIQTYYPNALDASSAAPIDVAAGAELTGYDIRLRKGRTFSIQGKAIDTATGAPPQNVLLTAVQKQEGSSSLLASMAGRPVQPARPPDGSFEFRNLVPGTYIVQSLPGANLNGAAPTPLTGRVEVTLADSNIDGVVLALGPGIEINGTMRLEDGDIKTLLSSQTPAVATGVVSAAGPAVPPAGVYRPGISLTEIDVAAANPPLAQVKENGTFKLQGLNASRFNLNLISLPEGVYVKAVRFGNQDITGAPLDLTSGLSGELEIVLSLRAAEVSGVLRDAKGEPLRGIQVMLWPKEMARGAHASGMKSANTDQNGSFKLTGLAPGEYFAAAWDDPEPGVLQSPDFLARFAAEATALKLGEGAHETAEVKLIPRARIAAETSKLP